jgi:hypothetical protein
LKRQLWLSIWLYKTLFNDKFTVRLPANKMHKPSPKTFSLIALVTGAVSLCLLLLPYVMFPQWYNPKTDGGLGYSTPATLEGWAFMIAGLALLGVAIVCAKLRKLD